MQHKHRTPCILENCADTVSRVAERFECFYSQNRGMCCRCETGDGSSLYYEKHQANEGERPQLWENGRRLLGVVKKIADGE